MFSFLMSRSEPSANDPPAPPAADLKRVLEQHIAVGFPPDLALDLVLNELVVRAADAARASAAALALRRGDEMVCRASTGLHAPDLGIPINTRDGLSGACVRSRSPQLSSDTESDPRVDAAVSRRLGIRSMLIVPIFEDSLDNDARPQLAGVLEVLSPLAYAFDERSQALLEEFARECASIRLAAAGLHHVEAPPELFPPELDSEDPEPTIPLAQITRIRAPYEAWTLVSAAVVIAAAVSFSFLIGSRIGWLRGPQADATQGSTTSESSPLSPDRASLRDSNSAHARSADRTTSKSARDATPSIADELVIYEKGKVVFRMTPVRTTGGQAGPKASDDAGPGVPKQAVAKSGSNVISASSSTRIPSPRAVWLAPAQADGRLLSRVEPQYPADALSARRAGSVVLEVHVAEDGTVSSVRPLNGDPVLANAATDAVRNWRYQPYAVQGHPAEFQTDVTLTFSLPN
jgi:TonB family protein